MATNRLARGGPVRRRGLPRGRRTDRRRPARTQGGRDTGTRQVMASPATAAPTARTRSPGDRIRSICESPGPRDRIRREGGLPEPGGGLREEDRPPSASVRMRAADSRSAEATAMPRPRPCASPPGHGPDLVRPRLSRHPSRRARTPRGQPRRPREHRHRRVALAHRLDEPAAVFLDDLGHERVVADQDAAHGVRMGLPQTVEPSMSVMHSVTTPVGRSASQPARRRSTARRPRRVVERDRLQCRA